MRVWLVKTGEPLPVDGEEARLFRMGILAQYLVDRGHEVVWWTSTFDHYKKVQRATRDTSVAIHERYSLEMLHSPGYRRNISIRRIIDHMRLGRKLGARMKLAQEPDVIFCAFPTIEMSQVAVEYGLEHNVPVVLDVRDLWPDIFLNVAPNWSKPLVKVLLSPMFTKTRWAFSNARAVSGITPGFVEWGLKYAGRNRTEDDRDFPLAYRAQAPTPEAIDSAHAFWKERGIVPGHGDFVVSFFGNISHQADLGVVIDAAKKLEAGGRRFRFVLCGDGQELEALRAQANGYESIVFPGWIGAAEIWTLMRMSSVGLVPYRRTFDFMASLPNKSIEYLSAGLPVLTSLDGTLGATLRAHECGFVYQNSQDLTERLIVLQESPDQLRAASHRAYQLYQERFIAERVYDSLIIYLERLARHGMNPMTDQAREQRR